jgi:hypothetical protein
MALDPNGGVVMKLTRKIIFAIFIALSLFGAASAVAGATHASAATAIEYGGAHAPAVTAIEY